MTPLVFPPEVGVKLTPMLAVCLGARTSGKRGPVRANPCPDMAAWVTIRVPNPGLDTVAVRVWVLPTGTLPKLMFFGLRLIPFPLAVPSCWVAGWLALSAEQPSIVARVRRTTTRLVRVPRFTGASTNAVRPYGRDLPALCTIPSANPRRDRNVE